MALAAIGAAGPDLPFGEAVLVLVLLGAFLHVHLDVFLGILPIVFLFLPLVRLRLKDEGRGLSFSLSEGLCRGVGAGLGLLDAEVLEELLGQGEAVLVLVLWLLALGPWSHVLRLLLPLGPHVLGAG